jgi:hypothetical protein
MNTILHCGMGMSVNEQLTILFRSAGIRQVDFQNGEEKGRRVETGFGG